MARPLLPPTQAGLAGSAVAGVIFVGLGVYVFNWTGLPRLFGFTLLTIGALAIGLSLLAHRRRRAPWAYLLALWGVVAFCAFFTAPKVLELPKLEQVTVDMELRHGPEQAKNLVSDENLKIRAMNLGLCVLFAAPFVVLCVGLARGRRDFERPVV